MAGIQTHSFLSVSQAPHAFGHNTHTSFLLVSSVLNLGLETPAVVRCEIQKELWKNSVIAGFSHCFRTSVAPAPITRAIANSLHGRSM
jgi:hypothetical protein